MGYIRDCKKKITLLFVLWGWVHLIIAQPNPQITYTEEQKINHLIIYIGGLDAVFIRNNTEHSAKEAMEHLKRKRQRAGKRVKTVDDFITLLASRSSISGNPYIIRFKNGKEFRCEMVLRLELKKLTEGKTNVLSVIE